MNRSHTSSGQLRVFLCHSSADKPKIRNLYHHLMQNGFAPWLDEEDLIPGQNWQEEISKAVRVCEVVIVCLSKGSITKEGYVQKEIKIALDINDEKPEGTIFIIPARLEDGVDVPERLRKWHWVDLFEKGGHEKLLLALTIRARSLGIPEVSSQRDPSISSKNQEARSSKSKSSFPTNFSLSLVRVIEAHSKAINSIAVSHHGRYAVSASDDCTVRVWDLETKGGMHVMHGHDAPVEGVAVTPNWMRAVSACRDSTLKVWDLENGRELRTLKGHSNVVNAVAVTPDGTRVVSASDDHTLRVWNLANGKYLRTLKGHSHYVSSVAVTQQGRYAVSASYDQTLKLWDLDDGRLILNLVGHSDGVLAVAVSGDGKRAISAALDNRLRVWDLSTGSTTRTLKGYSNYEPGYCVAVTQDGMRAALASGKTLKLWDLDFGSPLANFICEDNARCCMFVDTLIVVGDRGGRIYVLQMEK